MLVPFLAQPGEVIYRISRENMEGEPYRALTYLTANL